MACLSGAYAHAIEIGDVADEVRRGGDFIAYLVGGPAIGARPQPDHDDLTWQRICSNVVVGRTRNDGDGKIWHFRLVDVADGEHPLTIGARTFDVASLGQSARLLQGTNHRGKCAAQLHDCCGVGGAKAAGQLVDRQGAGQDGEYLVPFDEWGFHRGGGRTHRCDTGNDLDVKPIG